MGDLSLDDLHATADVVWDYTVSSDLAAKFDAAASAVEGQVGGRTSRRTTYGAHFQGYCAQLWSHNIDTANSDARLLASRLRDVAQGAREEFVGTSATGVSSALPDDLRSFTSEERAATDEIRSTPTTLSGRVEDFRTKCQWGQLACDQVLVGFNNYITSRMTTTARARTWWRRISRRPAGRA